MLTKTPLEKPPFAKELPKTEVAMKACTAQVRTTIPDQGKRACYNLPLVPLHGGQTGKEPGQVAEEGLVVVCCQTSAINASMLALRALECSQSPVGGGRVTAVFGQFCAKEHHVKMKSFGGDV